MSTDKTATGDAFAKHVGSRIRLYRKQLGYTLRDFAAVVHRSPSAISKYENGLIPVDVTTLYEIASALGVTVNQLTDYYVPSAPGRKVSEEHNFFKRQNLYYMYQYSAFDRKTWKCVLEIIPDPESDLDKIVMYYGVEDESDYAKCKFIYNGTIMYSDNHVFIFGENPYTDLDKIVLYVKVPFANESKTTGIILTMAESLRNPYAAKVLFSFTPLHVDDALKRELSIGDKDSMAEIKRQNVFAIYFAPRAEEDSSE